MSPDRSPKFGWTNRSWGMGGLACRGESSIGAVVQFIVAGPSSVTVVAQGSVEGDPAVRLVKTERSGALDFALAALVVSWVAMTFSFLMVRRSEGRLRRLRVL